MATEQSPERRKVRLFSTREDLQKALTELENLTSTLGNTTKMVVFAAFGSLLLVVGSFIVKSVSDLSTLPGGLVLIIFTVAVMLPLAGLVLLFSWERKVGQGKILYEEISDEIEWRHRTFRKKPLAREIDVSGDEGEPTDDPIWARGRPNIEIRLVLRRFLRESTLPFVPTSKASLPYATYFICCIVLCTLVIGSRISF